MADEDGIKKNSEKLFKKVKVSNNIQYTQLKKKV